ncbi:MAG: hypothetical protein ACRENP_23875 [Longimicrobiales bacterium]
MSTRTSKPTITTNDSSTISAQIVIVIAVMLVVVRSSVYPYFRS